MVIINSRTDLETYVRTVRPDVGADSQLLERVVAYIQDCDHPHYGRDWSEFFYASRWIDDAIEETIEELPHVATGRLR